MFKIIFAAAVLASCSSEGTFDGGASYERDGGHEDEDAAAVDAWQVCLSDTALGAPCVLDSDCVGATLCEWPRCDGSINKCVVTAGPPEGEPCGPGLACSLYRCCSSP